MSVLLNKAYHDPPCLHCQRVSCRNLMGYEDVEYLLFSILEALICMEEEVELLLGSVGDVKPNAIARKPNSGIPAKEGETVQILQPFTSAL